ncbi:hypothetical protein NUH86_16215 [Sphingobium sp. JS3065]|uniref:hypothetical protein n=1 Tax=Sphingobium sp. JS3065 TaxID=2970925 RepID=UPI002265216F|nr:hypothetical protein [Sphingobium sp. JS3065]UZW54995.1 hypothetical protein NUH86_16215 [Sphingobium sp. JS3065]
MSAQTVAPSVETTVAVPQAEPQAVAPAPVFAPTQPVIQPTPSVEQRLDAAIAASKAENVEAAPPVVEKRAAPKPAPRPMARAAEPAAPAYRADPPVERTVSSPPPPPAKVVVPAEPLPPVTRAPVSPSEAGIDPALLWALGGGSLLLAGLAGAALLRRRNRPEEEWVEEVSVAVPVEPAPRPASPVPLMAPPAAIVPARSDEDRSLEAMVAAPPSPENPFRTHAKRMTRARFLLAQQQERAETPSAPVMAPADFRPPESMGPESRQTVYRFGSDRRRETVFKPRTS